MLYSAMAGATRAVLEGWCAGEDGGSFARGVAGALPRLCGEVGAVKLSSHGGEFPRRPAFSASRPPGIISQAFAYLAYRILIYVAGFRKAASRP
jgi:hypothetical protein